MNISQHQARRRLQECDMDEKGGAEKNREQVSSGQGITAGIWWTQDVG